MTDLEKTRLCAEAMGLKIATDYPASLFLANKCYVVTGKRNTGNTLVSGKHISWDEEAQALYNPLHDDAQAMALVKKLRLSMGPNAEKPEDWWSVWTNEAPASEYQCADATDLNAAIVSCVAKLKGAKP